MFWDRIAGVYNLFCSVVNRKACKGLQEMTAALVTAEDEVLECACGTGLLTGVMAKKCKSLVATDYSAKMLEQARKNLGSCGHVTFRQGNILALDFPDESFDVVVAANVIHLLDEPYKALHEMERVCRRGGRLIIPTYINQNARGEKIGMVRVLEKIGVDFKRAFTLDGYKQFFEKAGCQQVTYAVSEGLIPCAVAVISKV